MRAMPHPRSIDRTAVAAMVLLCASWGFQQVCVKLALPELPPIAQAAIRSIGASLLVGLWAWWTLRDLRVGDGTFKPGILVGLIFAAEFVLLFLALARTDAGRVVMLLYTAPFVVAIGARFLPTPEGLSLDRWAGIAVAFAGVAILLSPDSSITTAMLVGDLMALGAGILWGLTTLIIKATKLRSAEPAKVLLYQLAVSAVAMTAASLAVGEQWRVPIAAITWSAMLYQVVWVTTVTYLIWFWLVSHYPPARLSVLSFLAPVFGVLFGHWLLGEALTGPLLLSLLLVTAGIVLVNRPARPANEPQRGWRVGERRMQQP
jgi:drug/metabolite transporter (DMT)-like permease